MRRNMNVIGIAVGAIGILYGTYSQVKMGMLANKIGMTIDNMDHNMVIEVPKHIIDTSLQQAVDREVSIVSHKAALTASSEISASIRKHVKEEVNNKFEELSTQVSNEIAIQVSKIDNSALASRVAKKAEEKMLDKLDGSLDDILEKYNNELKNVGKIYSSIADTIGKREDSKAMYFKI